MIKNAKAKFFGMTRGAAGTLQRHGKRVTHSRGSIEPTLCHMVEMLALGLIIDSRNTDEHPCVGEGVYPDPVRESVSCWTLSNAGNTIRGFSGRDDYRTASRPRRNAVDLDHRVPSGPLVEVLHLIADRPGLRFERRGEGLECYPTVFMVDLDDPGWEGRTSEEVLRLLARKGRFPALEIESTGRIGADLDAFNSRTIGGF